MNDKTDNPETNPEPSQPDPSEDMTPSPEQETAEDLTSSFEQELVVEGDPPDHEDVPAPENLEEKPAWMAEASPGSKSSFPFIPLLLVLVLGAVGGGGYWIYGEQKILQQEFEAGFNQITSRLNTLEADLQGVQKSQQRVEASSRSIEAYKSEVAQTFQAHQNSLSTLDEDVLRLKDSLNHLAQRQPALATSAIGSPPENTQPMENGNDGFGQAGDLSNIDSRSTVADGGGQTGQAELNDPERSQEAQEYIDFVESTSGKFFRLVREGFAKMWLWFVDLF